MALAQSAGAIVAAEATIFENQPNNNGGIYGEICFGNLSGTSATRRAFARFDLSAVPDGVVVSRVVYNFEQIRARVNCGTCPKPADVELRRVLEGWEEGLGGTNNAACGGGTNVPGVDWNNAPNTQSGTSAGAFMPSTNGAMITIDTDIGSDNDGLIADVQAWLNNPASNYGWEYRVADEADPDNARLVNPGTLTIYWTTVSELEFEDGFESP